MSSNYVDSWWAETDLVAEKGPPCTPCHGSGLVYVQGQETDCIDCEGYGSVPTL